MKPHFSSGRFERWSLAIFSSFVVLACAGVGSASAGRLVAIPRALSFGPRVVLAPYGDSRLARVRLKVDARQTSPVTITSAEIDSSQFTIQENSCIGNPIPPGAECVIPVTFTPSWWGQQRGTLTITSDASETPAIAIPLRGTGRRGRIAVRPRSLNFGRVELGSSRDLSVTLVNPNPIPLPQPQLSIEGSGFSVSATNCNSGDIPANGSCMTSISLAPEEPGTMSGSFQFDDSAAGSPHKVRLAGLAMGSASPTPTPTPTAVPTPRPEANLYVTNDPYSSYYGGCGGSVVAYPLGSSGNVSPLPPSPATRLCMPSAMARDPVSGNLYVANENNNSVTIYAAGASGNAAPIANLVGSKTGLSHPKGIALDSGGNIYVANSDINSITVYPPGSDGNAAPTATIAGGNTLLISPRGLALDTDGNLYAANNGTNSVTVYPPGSNGNISPAATIIGYNTGLAAPTGVAFDSKRNIYVSNSSNGSVTVYPPGSSGNASPLATLNAGAGIGAITLGSDDRIYLVLGATIGVYAAGAKGTPNPLITITGSDTRLASPAGIAVDASRNIYVANRENTITVFSSGSSGNAVPSATLGQGLQDPAGITVDPYGWIYVGEHGYIGTFPYGSNATVYPVAKLAGASGARGIAFDAQGYMYVANLGLISVYAPGSTGDTPPLAQILKPNSYNGPFSAIAVDSRGYIYVTVENGAILIYQPGSTGNVSPVVTIAGNNTWLNAPSGIALDSSGNMWVTSGFASNWPAVLVFPAGSNGNVAPSARIEGSATGLNSPAGIAFDSHGNIYVANAGTQNLWVKGTDSITVYPAGSSGNVAPIATIAGPNTGLNSPFGLAIGP